MRPNGFRRFTRAYIELPKKNTKTTCVSAVGIFMLYADGEPAAECYASANDREQAALVWNPAADMVEASPQLSLELEVIRSTKTIKYKNNCWFKAWSADATGKDGPDIHFCSVDELHAWKGQGRELWRKLKYGGIVRRQPLNPFVITNSGNDKHSLCWEQHEYATKIIEGRIFDDSMFALIFNASLEKLKENSDYWKTEECWKQTNPCYALTLRPEDYRRDVAECENNPAEESVFKQFRCGIWVESADPWVPSNVWDANAGAVNEAELAGKDCYSGLDLATTEDIAALVHVFPSPDGTFSLVCRFFCPEDTILKRVRKDNVRYDLWRDQGFLTATPGNVIDYKWIFNTIDVDAKKFRIREIAYDRWGATEIIQAIQERHIEVVPFGQGFHSMSAPTKDFYKLLKEGRIRHGGNPVLKWMASNASVKHDDAENVKIVKEERTKRIDGIIAAIMGMDRALRRTKIANPYGERGIRSL